MGWEIKRKLLIMSIIFPLFYKYRYQAIYKENHTVHQKSLGRKPSLRVTHPNLTVQFNIQFYNSLSTLHVSNV